jgi:hypothetical protein
MPSGEHFRPDWRDSAAYVPLLEADRALVAWEWLRRDRAYRRAERRHRSGSRADCPERWGLHAFEAPGLSIPDARPVWSSKVHPFVLPVRALPGASDDCIDLEALAPLCRIAAGTAGRQHLLISDGLRSIRIDVLQGKIEHRRLTFQYLVAGFESAERPLLTLRRLLALHRSGRFSAPLHSPKPRTARLVLMLRAADALASGALQRDIAAELLDPDARKSRWRVRSPSLRGRAQRLVGSARAMAAGGYLRLLRS